MPSSSPLLAYIERLPRNHLALTQRAALAAAIGGVSALVAPVSDAAAVPHLDAGGRDAYREFLAAPGHRAFVIAPGGTWAWKGDEPTPDAALDAATDACRQNTDLPCVPYAVDDRVVFDAKVWPTLWGPYLDAAAAARVPTGNRRGQRFFDLALRNPAGRPVKLSNLRGKVVLLHFWGSWCPPCRGEMTELTQFARHLGASIRPVIVQVREDHATARAWAERNHLNVPLHDSAAVGPEGDTLALADGSAIKDRELAPVFPSTYILDRHGVVVFAHFGPIADWAGYRPFLLDLAASQLR